MTQPTLPKTKLVSLFDDLCAGGWTPGQAAGWSAADAIVWHRRLIDAGLSRKTLPLAAVATELLAARQPDTVRGVMYAVVSVGWLPDTSAKSYGKVQRLLDKLRKRGVIPFPWVVDNIRSTMKPSSWSGLSDFADVVANAYRKDFWASLPDYLTIIVEKDTVAGRIYPVTREYDVPLNPLRGFSSTSFAWSIAQHWQRIDKPIHVLYIGDHDPAGRAIERSIKAALREYGGRDFTWKRLAVEPEHFEQFNMIPLKPKAKDRNRQAFIAEYGERCAEVEAIPADALRDMVKQAIEAFIPAEQWAKLKAIEQKEKQAWNDAMVWIQGEAL